MKKIAIVQSNYIPWKGYFDLIASVDEFILFDEVQFTKTDWRSRNRIKTPQGPKWISVPVGQNIKRRICDVKVSDDWQLKHWKMLQGNYGRAAYFSEIAQWLKPLYLEASYGDLSTLNRCFIQAICTYLGITTKISSSCDYEGQPESGKTQRIIDLCSKAGGNIYISGPAAQDYLVEAMFADAELELKWFNYLEYPEYRQLWGGFIHEVSIIDLLFNCGNESSHYMRYVA